MTIINNGFTINNITYKKRRWFIYDRESTFIFKN